MPDVHIERVVVTGGREFTDHVRIESDLRVLLPLGLRRVAEGACPFGGADDLTYDAWHLLRNEPTERYQIDDHLDGNGRGAPLRRNTRMVETERPDLGLGYPDASSAGTWHCIAEMLRIGAPVVVWMPWSNDPCAFAARKIRERVSSMNVDVRVLRSGHVAVRALELTSGPWPALVGAVEEVLRA